MTERLSVKDMLVKALQEGGYDGLCNDHCGCAIDDLAPCENISLDCVAAYARVCSFDIECRAWCAVCEGDYVGRCFTPTKPSTEVAK